MPADPTIVRFAQKISSYRIIHALLLAVAMLLLPLAVLAHSAGSGFLLLLPTTYYLTGGTLAVLATVILVSTLGESTLNRVLTWQWSCCLPTWFNLYRSQTVISLISLLCLVLLLVEGLFGSPDPLVNALPLTIWTLFWVVVTLLHALVGNLWSWINPWTGLHRLIRGSKQPPLTLSDGWGYWLATVGIFTFAWFELVSLSPEDPSMLAIAVIGYWLFNFLAMSVFGHDQWLQRGEAFSVFFRLVSLLSPLSVQTTKDVSTPACSSFYLSFPGTRLLNYSPSHWSIAVFILTTLATVSFDGLNKTFFWLRLNGINPLAYAGRSTVTGINTLGLVLSALTLISLFLFCIILGWRISGRSVSLTRSISLFSLTVLPISLAYHFSHYLSQVLVNAQYFAKAITGSDLTVTTSFLSNHHSVERLWQLQVIAVVGGHILSAVLTHFMAIRLYPSVPRAMRSQLALATLMILYTWFGLWLLSSPTGL